MKNIFRDNLIKNTIVLAVLIGAFGPIRQALTHASIPLDAGSVGSLLVAVSILGVTACFGNFAFTYEKIESRSKELFVLAHVTTGLLMLVIGMSLEMTSVLVELLMGKFILFDLSLGVLYIASVLYDFWDVMRVRSS